MVETTKDTTITMTQQLLHGNTKHYLLCYDAPTRSFGNTYEVMKGVNLSYFEVSVRHNSIKVYVTFDTLGKQT